MRQRFWRPVGVGAGGRLPGLRPFLGFDALAPLRDHVAVAARVFLPEAVALGGDDRGHNPVEEIAVVADEQDRALVVGEHLFEQVKSIEVEVVGRLIKHQHVGGRGQRYRKRETRPLAPRQHRDRRSRLLRRKQEILHVAHDVLLLAADADVVAAALGKRGCHGCRGI